MTKSTFYIFDFKSDLFLFYIHAMNFFFSFMHVINKMNKSVVISRKMQVDTLTKWNFINIYHIDIEEAVLAFKKKSQ